MGKYIKFFGLGILFGIVLTKAEVISWYRIYEMFRFQSFHMYGVIGSAVLIGIIIIQLIKRFNIKSFSGHTIMIVPKERVWKRYIIGGTIFGLGWALTGACPGPMFILVGNGFLMMLAVIVSAAAGTFTYGLLKNKLPH
ncbi:DUF6691 family protein [Fulvivirga lutimaris]|uniref:DUF6691 family protein n=1 Tax=Fulvivirga lutimaris TaxID=1819566 RepID=UPI0012BBCC03|nr:DUF6691 family protein [Fulvivirga lutimaris]MTI39829.1 YeeE/YedE family protein [Fulvivirga lutimaris]